MLGIWLAGMMATATETMEVPVADLDGWTTLEFNGIPANDVATGNGSLRIVVRESASPLVYRFDECLRITGINVAAKWTGSIELPTGAVQGDENADDFVLKLGIVEAGDRRLNWLQRRIAADWIKRLFELASDARGIERIHFLSTTRQRDLVGSSRIHPLSDLLHETRIVYLDGEGDFEMSHEFDRPVDALGLWISSDGDNTGSSFEVVIDSITLQPDHGRADAPSTKGCQAEPPWQGVLQHPASVLSRK